MAGGGDPTNALAQAAQGAQSYGYAQNVAPAAALQSSSDPSVLAKLAQAMPGAMQQYQRIAGQPQQPMAHATPHPMSGAPVQMPGLLGPPQITVPQMNQLLGRANGLLQQ